MIFKALSIAGSDPSGGAGIQADLKTFSALGVYGMAALTSVTAQNTKGVRSVMELQPTFVRQQIEAIYDDIAVHAVKIGMVASASIAQELADVLKERSAQNIVLDPVMVATSGDTLISDAAIDVVRTKLLPLADLITPNIKEAEVLLKSEFTGDMEGFARALLDLGARNVMLKGGHLTQQKHSDDVLQVVTAVNVTHSLILRFSLLAQPAAISRRASCRSCSASVRKSRWVYPLRNPQENACVPDERQGRSSACPLQSIWFVPRFHCGSRVWIASNQNQIRTHAAGIRRAAGAVRQ